MSVTQSFFEEEWNKIIEAVLHRLHQDYSKKVVDWERPGSRVRLNTSGRATGLPLQGLVHASSCECANRSIAFSANTGWL